MLTALPTGKESWAMGCLDVSMSVCDIRILADAVPGNSKAKSDLE